MIFSANGILQNETNNSKDMGNYNYFGSEISFWGMRYTTWRHSISGKTLMMTRYHLVKKWIKNFTTNNVSFSVLNLR